MLIERWVGGGLGSAGLPVGLSDLKGLSRPKRFRDSMICIL